MTLCRHLFSAALLSITLVAPAAAQKIVLFREVPTELDLRRVLAPETLPAGLDDAGLGGFQSKAIEFESPAPAPSTAPSTGSGTGSGPRPSARPRPVVRPAQVPSAQPATSAAFLINFAVNSDRIEAASIPYLDRIASLLRTTPGLSLAIEGHADASGGDTVNDPLSVRRANAVRAFLIERYAIGAERLSAMGHGARQPLIAANPYDALNRRVQFDRLPPIPDLSAPPPTEPAHQARLVTQCQTMARGAPLRLPVAAAERFCACVLGEHTDQGRKPLPDPELLLRAYDPGADLSHLSPAQTRLLEDDARFARACLAASAPG